MKKRVVNKKRCNCKKDYLECWNFIKESRYFIYFGIFLFLIFFLIGFFFELPEIIRNSLLDMINELISEIDGKNFIELFWFILWNNLKVAFYGIISGVLFGIGSIILASANGFVPGFVAALSVTESGFASLWRLIPHGIFEMPAIFISFGMGIRLGTFIFASSGKKIKTFKEYLTKSMKVFFYIILPLLIIAAIIETTLICAGI